MRELDTFVCLYLSKCLFGFVFVKMFVCSPGEESVHFLLKKFCIKFDLCCLLYHLGNSIWLFVCLSVCLFLLHFCWDLFVVCQRFNLCLWWSPPAFWLVGQKHCFPKCLCLCLALAHRWSSPSSAHAEHRQSRPFLLSRRNHSCCYLVRRWNHSCYLVRRRNHSRCYHLVRRDSFLFSLLSGSNRFSQLKLARLQAWTLRGRNEATSKPLATNSMIL